MINNKDLFVYFIQEREKVRIQHDAGKPKPWTDDVILQSIRFTNVDREKDRTTIYIRNRYAWNDWLYVNTVIARFINRIDALEQIPPYDGSISAHEYVDIIRRVFAERKAAGKTNTCGVYLIGSLKTEELLQWLETLFDSNLQKDLNSCSTCKQYYDRLTSIKNLGSFIANQIVQDIKNTAGSNLYNAPDRRIFTSHGPGSLRGISIYFDTKVTPATFIKYLGLAFNEVREKLMHDDPYKIIEQLDYHNLQNCFCEYSKYMNQILGLGRRIKNRYDGEVEL